MKSLTFISRRVRQGSEGASDLYDILSISRANNKKNALTGILLATNYVFCQFIEGPSLDLQKIADRILADTRHTGLVILSIKSGVSRIYSDWEMEYAAIESSKEVKLLSLAKSTSFNNSKHAAKLEGLLKELSEPFINFTLED